ncbi:MAG: acetyl-CoA carboxylase biotin carboxylase subunit [Proteobacteria bacterium]|nr:acetyl-CoA carboxylase biotin carboxylase subunit [Pseudomonadota bacterium]MBU1713075.1 acetyl-CoA carboxylase biotin carboxylase subunit [Pseudomonadota bacterium]
MKGISRVLIANRGEIAVRIIRACREMEIETVLTVSEADRESLPAQMADRCVCIGPRLPAESYLKVETIVAAAFGTGSDAIHPGYGFLAEQPSLPEACEKYGLIFVGPSGKAIRQMGDKLVARRIVKSLGIPMIPGSDRIANYHEAMKTAEKIGYPVLLKASAGGGGKGMKTVTRAEDLKTLFDEASAEARAAFGDERLYMEHFIHNARHIEIQIVGDAFGNAIHLFERDCSIQRRYQKMIEEAPSPAIDSEIREKMCLAAIEIVRHIKYENVGTVEFILDQDQRRFYFLEMNTRIQVEHPVTEMITGIDLVKEQFRVSAGQSLSFTQQSVRLAGHAIECRINAESPYFGFRPSPGRITRWEAPVNSCIRLDTHCYPGYFVPPFYDSLLGKLIAFGDDRLSAIERMQTALGNMKISGVDTTIPFHQFVLNQSDYRRGIVNTCWVENKLLKEFEAHEND